MAQKSKTVPSTPKRAAAPRVARNAREVKAFCTQLPTAAVNKLRTLSGLTPVVTKDRYCTVFLRFKVPVYERLRKLAVARPSSRGMVGSMSQVLTDLFEEAKAPKKPLAKPVSMLSVATALVVSAPLRR